MAWNCWGYYMYIKSILRAFKSFNVFNVYREKKWTNTDIRPLVIAHFLGNCNSVNKETKRIWGLSVYQQIPAFSFISNIEDTPLNKHIALCYLHLPLSPYYYLHQSWVTQNYLSLSELCSLTFSIVHFPPIAYLLLHK